jgi:hypothetical protein
MAIFFPDEREIHDWQRAIGGLVYGADEADSRHA